MKAEKLNSPINAPRMQADRDKQAKASLSKSGRGQKAMGTQRAREAEKAEKTSYKLSKQSKF